MLALTFAGMSSMTRSQNGPECVHDTNFTLKMQPNETFPRSYLQNLRAKRRAENVANIINNHVQQIFSMAITRSTSYVFRSFTHHSHSGAPYGFDPTPDELVDAFKTKFPGCSVDYTEAWEEVRPGVKEQRRSIKIDWS